MLKAWPETFVLLSISEQYSVGEYFDTNKDLLSKWIADSRKASSVFDFGMRYKLKDSIHQDNYEHMLDDFYGPMIWYDKVHSVSFLDNHDTAGKPSRCPVCLPLE